MAWITASSPRAWGCFRSTARAGRRDIVFPTRVGVFPEHSAGQDLRKRLPHARGGVSKMFQDLWEFAASSPRAWGCFLYQSMAGLPEYVFPTRVGVFLYMASLESGQASLPHARGGVSLKEASSHLSVESSPRAWGCFRPGHGRRHLHHVFPTRVGVFPTKPLTISGESCLPHARGGVSTSVMMVVSSLGSSPRAWGCFRRPPVARRLRGVFPTRVGVFPQPRRRTSPRRSLPHARGGVSVHPSMLNFLDRSSPRAWGCFYDKEVHLGAVTGLPHARGGVSVYVANANGPSAASPRAWGCFSAYVER